LLGTGPGMGAAWGVWGFRRARGSGRRFGARYGRAIVTAGLRIPPAGFSGTIYGSLGGWASQ